MHVQIPEAFEFLFDEKPRYIVAHGGRGSGKSINIARRLILRCLTSKRRVLCAREIQSTIADSVHRTIADEIAEMGLDQMFDVQKATILGPHGSEFVFKGLKFNIKEIKSTKGVTDCWIEEAQVVSKTSFETLDPTIRVDGSQIFMSFNPELEEDYIYDRFVVNEDPDALVCKVGWEDNPFFPDVLRRMKDAHETRDPVGAQTVWGGHPRQTLDGAVYANEMLAATSEGRITRVPPVPGKPVSTFWDLGRSDYTSVWFAQLVGYEYRIIDFYEDSGLSIGPHLKVMQDRPYVYDLHWLPHDATHKQIMHPLSVEAQAKQVYPDKVRIVPKVSINDGINAARTIFPNCVFDQQKCADGLQHLRRYCFKIKDGHYSKEPDHNEHSHAADAFRYLALALKAPVKKATKSATPLRPAMAGAGWMRR